MQVADPVKLTLPIPARINDTVQALHMQSQERDEHDKTQS